MNVIVCHCCPLLVFECCILYLLCLNLLEAERVQIHSLEVYLVNHLFVVSVLMSVLPGALISFICSGGVAPADGIHLPLSVWD